MSILFAISILALAALLWASLSIARHIRQARRRSVAGAVLQAADPEAELAAEAFQNSTSAAPRPLAGQPEPSPQPAEATSKLTYFKWDEAEPLENLDDSDDPEAQSGRTPDSTHDPVSLHASQSHHDSAGHSYPAHKDT